MTPTRQPSQHSCVRLAAVRRYAQAGKRRVKGPQVGAPRTLAGTNGQSPSQTGAP